MSESTAVEVGTREPRELAERASEIVSADDLLRIALQPGDGTTPGIEIVERIVALRERDDARRAERSFYDALSRFQEACPVITKSKDGLKTKDGTVVSKYAPLDKVVTVARPILRENGFAFKWDSRTEGGMMHTTCTLRHEDGHSDTSTFSAPVGKISSLTSAMQDHSGALTYGERQSFVMVTGITTADEDNDGQGVPEQPETINAKQIATLKKLAGEAGEHVSLSAMFDWLGLEVGAWAEIPAERYNETALTLKLRIAEANKSEAKAAS